jgi:hypothetical protein
MNTPLSYITIIVGILITGCGWMLGSSENDLLGQIFSALGWMAFPLLSIIPGTLLVWWGGLLGRLTMPIWVRVLLSIFYACAL